MFPMFELLTAGAEPVAIPALTEGLFSFGAEHITALSANASSLITSFWPIILIVVGLALAMWIVKMIIGAFGKKAR